MCIYFVTVPENYAEARGVLLLLTHTHSKKPIASWGKKNSKSDLVFKKNKKKKKKLAR